MTVDATPAKAASTGNQIIYLLFLILRLKTWTLLFWIILLPAIFFNLFNLRALETENPDAIQGTRVVTMTASLAAAKKALVSSPSGAETKTIQEVLKSRGGTGGNNWPNKCQSVQECQDTFLASIMSLSMDTRSYMKFEKKISQLECLDAERSDVLCPYMFHVMSQSLDAKGPSGSAVFKDVKFLKVFDKYETDAEKRAKGNATTIPDSLCKRTTVKNDGHFFFYFPDYFMVHMLLLAVAMVMYFTVSTLSSVTSLKENGFLQLMFNSGLSVGAYWLVVLFITMAEGLLIASLFTVSYYIQCPSFYPSDGLLKSLLMLWFFFVFMASIGLLSASLLGSYFITLLLMIFLNFVLTIMAMMNRNTMKQESRSLTPNSEGIMLFLLIFPPAHIVEYIINAIVPQDNKYFPRPTAFHGYFTTVEILMPTIPAVLLLLTVYLDFVLRNGNGLCLPYTYPFNPSFWSPQSKVLIEMTDDADQPKKPNIEKTKGVPSVIANDIHMSYPAGLCAAKRPPVLKGVTCTVYQDQITALIGHNGAGKTTLIRVLMGEEIPTSGLAVINGLRVTDPYQRLALRGSVSICKQVDVLSSYLTVMETMKLSLLAKGFSVDSQVSEVLEMMKQLGLEGKENVKAMDLSGGQMRKVCSIICLLGNPRLVILDEPTSGLDPVSRRNLWQILKEHKAGRSIILCTQFMDEADILADRKMFLSAGKMICAGSSLFLKHAFGCSVSISVSLKLEGQVNELMKKLKNKKVKLLSAFKTELQLEVTSKKPATLAAAIKILEASHPQLVDAFGVSQAQLDDIFMRLQYIDMENIEGTFKSKKLRKLGKKEMDKAKLVPVDYKSLYDSKSSARLSSSLIQQSLALMVMSLNRQRKVKMKFCFRLLFPLVLVVTIWSMVESEQSEATSKTPKQPDPRKGIVRSDLVNFTTITQKGICVFDSDTETVDANVLKNMTADCVSIFNSKTGTTYILLLHKAQKITVESFFQLQTTLTKVRKICYEYCFIVYASSWAKDTSNNDRLVEVGQYSIPADVIIPNLASGTIGHLLGVYVQFARHFNAIPTSNSVGIPKLSETYTINTFDKFTFYTSFDVLFFITAFSIVPITYLGDPIEDKDSGVRQHLACMGMSSLAYWLNTFLMHWLHYAIYFLLSVAVCLTWERYQSSFFIVYVCLPVLFLGTVSSQLSVYVVSALLKKSNDIVVVSYFTLGMFLGVGAVFLQDTPAVSLALAIILPPFTPVLYLFSSVKIMVYCLLYFQQKTADSVPGMQSIFFGNQIIIGCLAAIPVHIAMLIALLIAIDNPGCMQSLCTKTIPSSAANAKPVKDEGVKREIDRINKTVRDPVNMLEVRDLQKIYPNGVHAVRGTTFGTLAGEIIGLLGPNGAGKTTSMSIIVGEEAQSSGTSEVHFAGAWMSGMDGAKIGAIGYCPQHNPLFNQISVEDHLVFYAKIRGLTAELAKVQITGLIDGLGLKPHREKAAEQLSGGNKRRLCLAIALLGNPSLIVIDEASTGVDPENKRFIWAAIRGMASKERSVMITTHSMEEVEALCSRVGIMNKGLMIAFGTVQQLRSRHGEAYTLDVLMKAKKPRRLEVKKKKLMAAITEQFQNCRVMEDLMRCIQFFIPKESVECFSQSILDLQKLKKKLGIKYFSLCQMSLDQVFVKLVKEYDAT